MNKILSRFLSVLKYPLLILSFGLLLYGMISTFKRLDKNLADAINIFLPFAIIFVLFVINIFVKNSNIKDNLLFNFACVIVFIVIILICVRAQFDTSMLLYYKYKINYNPSFLTDNLASIRIMLYCLIAGNVFYLLLVPLNRNVKPNKTSVTIEELPQQELKNVDAEPIVEPIIENSHISDSEEL